MSDHEINRTRTDPARVRCRDGHGMVTAELAVAILAAMAVLTMLCWCLYLVVLQVRIVDTAGEVARQAARGDDAGVKRAQREAPAGSRVSVHAGAQVTSVHVQLTARPLADLLVSVPLHADAEVVTEPAPETP